MTIGAKGDKSLRSKTKVCRVERVEQKHCHFKSLTSSRQLWFKINDQMVNIGGERESPEDDEEDVAQDHHDYSIAR